MKLFIKRLALGSMFFALTSVSSAMPPEVPETIYQWVQSSSRMNYFFNKEQICYGVGLDGMIDLNVVIVPVVKTYDAVQIEDVIEKRRWRMLSTDEYSALAGEANYLRFDLARRTVLIEAVDYIDVNFWTISHTTPNKTVEIDKLSDKSRDGIFYRAILDYIATHGDELIAHTKGKLRHEDAERIEKEHKEAEKRRAEMEKRLEKERKEEAKRLEKERREEGKRLEKERREEAKRLAEEKKSAERAER